jgi:hypothetical protein
MKVVAIVAFAGCTTLQEAVTGGAAGGVAGFALAGSQSELVSGAPVGPS